MIASACRPDRAKGIFETLLVVDGEPVELEAHLHRLAQSLDALYGLGLPGDTEKQLQVEAGGLELGRLRLTAAPISSRDRHRDSAAELQIAIDAVAIDPEVVFPRRGIRLLTQPLPSGLGPHKLIDRPEEISRPAPDQPGALIVDEGEVLEAGWANVFAVRGGTLITPPLDGRILPGTTRAALLALVAEAGIEAVERSLRPDDLLDADETFLSGSIRGIEAALELDGQPLAGCGPISQRLAGALRRRWGLTDGLLPAAAAAPKPGLLAR